jgi:hypothetical protein
VKDQSIGLLHLVPSFLRGNFRRHAEDYSIPSFVAAMRERLDRVWLTKYPA